MEQVIFDGLVQRFVFEDSQTGIRKYQVSPNSYKDSLNVETNWKGLVNIEGDLPYLELGEVYRFKANLHKHPKYGYYYVCEQLVMNLPANKRESIDILETVTSKARAKAIIKAYPNFFDLVMNNEEIDPKPIFNVGYKTLSYITEKLENRFAVIKVYEALDCLLPFSLVERLMNKVPNSESIKALLATSPYNLLCNTLNMGFKRADEILSNIVTKDPNTSLLPKNIMKSKDRLLFAAQYALERAMFSKGHTYFDKNSLSTWLQTEANADKDLIQEVLEDNLFVVDGDNITTRKMYNKEKFIYNTLIDAVNDKDAWELEDLESYRDTGQFPLSDKQLQVIQSVFENKITILNGYAGTGKTSAIEMLVKALQDHGKTFLLTAPTGKAAKVLSKYTGVRAGTIHMSLGCRGLNPETGYVEFFYGQDNPLDVDMVIVDETSMVDTNLLDYLLKAVDFSRSHILFIGDDAQLPSVGAGNVFSVMLNSGKIPKISLTEVHRFKEGGIATTATEIRLGNLQLQSNKIFGEDESYIFNDLQSDQILKNIVLEYEKLLKSGVNQDDILVLTYKRQPNDKLSTAAINKKMQEYFNPRGKAIENSKNKFRVNDIVMQRVNNYKAIYLSEDDYNSLKRNPKAEVPIKNSMSTTFIPNGETGRVRLEIPSGMIVQFDDKYIFVDKTDYNSIELAYSITIHKSQGSQASHVILVSPREHSFGMTSNLLYVAVTRAKDKCIHLGSGSTVNQAVKRVEHVERRTNLENFFKREDAHVK